MKRIKNNRILLILLAGLVTVLLGFYQSVGAAPSTGSLTIKGNSDIANVKFTAYQVGNIIYRGSVTYELTDDFSGSGVVLDELADKTASEVKDAANTLLNYAAAQKITPKDSKSANNSGEVTFSDLPLGVYLVIQCSGEDKVEVSPVLAGVPTASDEGFVYDVEVYPKSETIPESSPQGYEVSFNKQDRDGNPVTGAVLAVYLQDEAGNAAGEAIESWESNGSTHTIKSGIWPGVNYILVEEKVPIGYLQANPIKFKLNDDGKVSLYNEQSQLYEDSVDASTITMIDDYKGRIIVTKNVYYNGELLTGDEDEAAVTERTFYVALYSDADFTKRVNEIKKIDMTGKTADTVIFENLDAGTYYVVETDESGTFVDDLVGIDYVAEVDNDGVVTVEQNKTAEVIIKNLFEYYPSGYYDPEETTTTPEYESTEEISIEEDTTPEDVTGYYNESTTSSEPTISSNEEIEEGDDSDTTASSIRSNGVFTGDHLFRIVIWIIVLAASIGGILFVVYKKSKK